MPAFSHTRSVEFHETDAAGLVHFSVYLRYVEAAEHALLRELGQLVPEHREGSIVGWPRTSAEIRYRGPLRAGASVVTKIGLDGHSERALHWRFAIHSPDTLAAEGTMQVLYAVHEPETQKLAGLPLPEGLLEQLQAYRWED